MITFVAILTFAGAFGAAGFAIYATVAPAMSNIRSALSGNGVQSMLPELPPRRVATMRVTTVRPVAGESMRWRAAA
jgi:hypothetical protein